MKELHRLALEEIGRAWEIKIFGVMKQHVDFDEPISKVTLAKPKDPMTQFLLYMWSLETFIYDDVNKALRFKDENSVENLGPFCFCLSKILNSAPG